MGKLDQLRTEEVNKKSEPLLEFEQISRSGPEALSQDERTIEALKEDFGVIMLHPQGGPANQQRELARGIAAHLRREIASIPPDERITESWEIIETLSRAFMDVSNLLRNNQTQAPTIFDGAVAVLRADKLGRWRAIGVSAGINKIYRYNAADGSVEQINIDDNVAGGASHQLYRDRFADAQAQTLRDTFGQIGTLEQIKSLTAQEEYLFRDRNKAGRGLRLGERIGDVRRDNDGRALDSHAPKNFSTELKPGDLLIVGSPALDSLTTTQLATLIKRTRTSRQPAETMANIIEQASRNERNPRAVDGPVQFVLIQAPEPLEPDPSATLTGTSLTRPSEGTGEEEVAASAKTASLDEAKTTAEIISFLRLLEKVGRPIQEGSKTWTASGLIAVVQTIDAGILTSDEADVPAPIRAKLKQIENAKPPSQ